MSPAHPALGNAALAAIGWPAAPPQAWVRLLAEHPHARLARVVEQHRSGYRLSDAPNAELFSAESPAPWQRPRTNPVERACVGDWVLVEGGQIIALLPRTSVLKRGAAGEHYRQQLIAANIDTCFVVSGLDADFNPRRLERYLTLLQGSGVVPVVVLTKMDVHAETAGLTQALLELASAGIAVRQVNAKDAQSVMTLHPWLQPGMSVVLVGSSGAGKSTLTNTLLGDERMKTNAVREGDARGRHTTTHRALQPLPTGACLIDTPGMRELKPTGEETDSAPVFDDLEALAATCRFRDCKHVAEPGCAVRAAVDTHAVDAARVVSWQKLDGEVTAAANALATRQHAKTAAKRQTRAMNAWLDTKRGEH